MTLAINLETLKGVRRPCEKNSPSVRINRITVESVTRFQHQVVLSFVCNTFKRCPSGPSQHFQYYFAIELHCYDDIVSGPFYHFSTSRGCGNFVTQITRRHEQLKFTAIPFFPVSNLSVR